MGKSNKIKYFSYKHRIRQVATKKPGVDDFYIKNVYSEIADYPKRKVPYYEDKKRYESIYTTDYIKNLKEDNYTKEFPTIPELIPTN